MNVMTGCMIVFFMNHRWTLGLILLSRLCDQIIFKIYEAAEMQPLLDAANAEKAIADAAAL